MLAETESTLAAGLSPAARVLLAKLLQTGRKVARDELAPGVYEVNECVGVALRGEVRVGRDYTQRLVAKADPWGLAAVLLEELQEKALAAGEAGIDLDRLVRLSLCVDEDLAKRAKERADKIVSALKEETLSTCAGKTTCAGVMEWITP